MKKNIAIVTGGYSEEHEISLKSAKTVKENLILLYNISVIYIEKENWYSLLNGNRHNINNEDFTLRIDNTITKFDAFCLIYCFRSL